MTLSISTLLQDTGLYYDRYLREVIEVLETDPHFREKLQTANTEDIKVRIPLCSCTNVSRVTFNRKTPDAYVFTVLSARTVVLVKSWTWSATMSGLDWMN